MSGGKVAVDRHFSLVYIAFVGWRAGVGHLANRPAGKGFAVGKYWVLALVGLIVGSLAGHCGTLTGIYVVPGYVALSPDAEQQFKVMGIDGTGKQVPITEPVTWTLTNSKAGTISPAGRYHAGTATDYYICVVRATTPSGLTALANVEVRNGSSSGGFQWDRTWGNEAPGQLSEPRGIAVDSRGHYIVADTDNSRIEEVDKDGRFIRQIGSHGSEPGKFDQPTAVAIDADDNIYVADRVNDRVQKLSHDGKVLAVWGGKGGGEGQFLYPNSLTLDGNGCLFVTDTYNNRVQKFDTSGHFLKAWGGRGLTDGKFYQPIAIAADSIGNVYVLDGNYPESPITIRVQKFTNDGVFIKSFGTYGEGPGQLREPGSIAIDSTDHVYVTDCARVHRFDSEGRFESGFGNNYPTNNQIPYVCALTIGVDGNIVVASHASVYKFSSSGADLGHWGGEEMAGRLDGCWGMAVSGHSPTYLAVHTGSTYQIFDGSGQWVTKWDGVQYDNNSQVISICSWPDGNLGALDVKWRVHRLDLTGKSKEFVQLTGFETDHWWSPTPMAIGGDGSIYLVNGPNMSTIYKFDPSGRLVTSWIPLGKNGCVRDFCVGPDNCFYNIDFDGYSIQKFDSSGRLIKKWGAYGDGPGQFQYPSEITTDATGNIYVLDNSRFDVQKFDSEGNHLSTLKCGRSIPEGFGFARGIEFGSDGSLYIQDGTGRIIKYRATADSLTSNAIKPAVKPTVPESCVVSSSNQNEPLTPRPLGMSNAAIGGGGQPPLWGWRWVATETGDADVRWIQLTGPRTVGMLVKTWGRVVTVDENARTIAINDGFGPDEGSIKCVVTGTGAMPSVGDFAIVTGIVSVETTQEGYAIPFIRLRTAEDLVVVAR